MTYADYILQIESKAYLIQLAALKIDKVSVAELPLVFKYQVYVMHWGYKDEASTIKEIFLDKWTNGDAGSPAGTCGAQLGNRREGAGSAGARVHPMEGAAGGRGWRVSSEGSPEPHLHQGQNQRCAQVTGGTTAKAAY